MDIILILIIILFIALIIKFNKQVKWLLTPLIWFKDIIDPQWWAEKIFYKLKLDRLANNPYRSCLLYTSPSPRDKRQSRMPSSA